MWRCLILNHYSRKRRAKLDSTRLSLHFSDGFKSKSDSNPTQRPPRFHRNLIRYGYQSSCPTSGNHGEGMTTFTSFESLLSLCLAFTAVTT